MPMIPDHPRRKPLIPGVAWHVLALTVVSLIVGYGLSRVIGL